jgi:hypothetical protein
VNTIISNADMTKKHQNLSNSQRLLLILEELHQWELDNMTILHTMTGRHIYMTLASMSFHAGDEGVSLKSIKNNNHYTDKAIAIRLSKFQKMEMIQKFNIDFDGRTKIIIPQEKLHTLWEIHSDIFYKTINKYYTLIPK